jgi:decaprenylphospho-beta-D-ribofuranose 2-oxidase
MASLRTKKLTLSGWGRYPQAETLAFRPERRPDLAACLPGLDGNLIARGAGRSYGDQALNGGGTTILTERLDRMISFDPETGRLVTEPGVTFATLLDVFLPRGYLTPVSPGTSYATLGGAIANDVHGKNHDRMGSFSDHVAWVELLLPSGETKRVSEHEDPALFRATIGGAGLTGIITSLAVDLMRVPSNAVDLTERRVADLDQFIALLAEARANSTYSVGWIDALAKGRELGRGILETAELSATPIAAKPRRQIGIPVNFPRMALNSLSVRAFNQLYYSRVPAAGRQRHIGISEFLYPLDAVANWNRIYGKPGFSQFQCVLPDATAPAGLRKMLEAVSAAGAASFLAVLKTLGRQGKGMLSFPMPGFTLALDFPRRRGTEALLAELERLTLEAGGRIYLAKDSALSAEGMAAMYPELSAFRMVLSEIDPDRQIGSDQARRLRLRT